MAEQWRIRRGTNTENNAFTGALGEVTMDTDRNEVRIHDGSTVGGYKVGGEDYVISYQTPSSSNNYTWYRKYKSGWVEQGGNVNVPGPGGATPTFPVIMIDTNYNVQITGYVTTDSDMNQDTFWCTHRYTDKIGIDLQSATNTGKCFWEVKGFAE